MGREVVTITVAGDRHLEPGMVPPGGEEAELDVPGTEPFEAGVLFAVGEQVEEEVGEGADEEGPEDEGPDLAEGGGAGGGGDGVVAHVPGACPEAGALGAGHGAGESVEPEPEGYAERDAEEDHTQQRVAPGLAEVPAVESEQAVHHVWHGGADTHGGHVEVLRPAPPQRRDQARMGGESEGHAQEHAEGGGCLASLGRASRNAATTQGGHWGEVFAPVASKVPDPSCPCGDWSLRNAFWLLV